MSKGTEKMTVIEEIATERRRQIDVEGFDANHDDEHANGELAAAAGVYALVASCRFRQIAKQYWPFDYHWWKPSDPRTDLVKAGALIVAEIERIDRATGATS